MSVPEVIDVHVHYTRSRQQEKLVFNHPGWPDEWYNANPEGLETWFENEGLSHIFAINYIDINRIIDNRVARVKGTPEEAAARAELQPGMTERVKQFNDWIVEYCQTESRVTPFVNVDIGVFYGDQNAMMEELDKQLAAGAKGVKIHPGLSRFYPGDEKMFPLYEKLSQAGVPILSDSGSAGGREPGSTAYGEPDNFRPVFEKFPKLGFIMAHLTTAFWDERIALAKDFPHVQFDISGGFYQPNGNGRARDAHRCVPIEDAARYLKTIGTDRVMFGTDAPGSEVRGYVRTIMGLDLTDAEKENILAKNARNFICLK